MVTSTSSMVTSTSSTVSSAIVTDSSAAPQTANGKQVDKFRDELVQLLSALPDHSVLMSRLPEEFARHFGRPFILTEYGVKKTTQLLSELTKYFKVHVHKCIFC